MAMAEKSTSGQEEVQTATHSSRERVIEKVEKPPVTKVDSGLGGEPETLDRAHICQLQDDAHAKKDKAAELIQQAREQGRCEAEEKMKHIAAQWYKDTDQLMVQLSTITHKVQNLQLAMSEQFPGIDRGREAAAKQPKTFTQEIPQPFGRQASINRQSSEESCKNIAVEETACRCMVRESSGTPPISPNSCRSDDSLSMACAIPQSMTAKKEMQVGTSASSDEEQLSGPGVEQVHLRQQSDKKKRLKRQ